MDYLESFSIVSLVVPFIVLILIVSIVLRLNKRRGTVWGMNPKSFSSDGTIEIKTGETFILVGSFSFLSQRISYSGMVSENTFAISMFIFAGRGGMTTYPVFYSKDSNQITLGKDSYRVLSVNKEELRLQKNS